MLAASKADVTRASLQIALLYVVVEQARAAQHAPIGNAQQEPLAQETEEEGVDAQHALADTESEEQNIDEVAAQDDSPLDPAEAASQLRALIEQELEVSAQARGLSADQLMALDEQDAASTPQASIQNSEPVKVQGTVQTGWPGFELPDIKTGDAGVSPMALLGGALFAGLAGGGGGGVASAAVKVALYSMGIVADGYISGATVKLFGMVNGQEVVIATTTTNAQGAYQFEKSLLANATKIVATGGTDISTGLAFNVELKAPATASVINPLTTLVQAYVEQNSGLNVSVDQAMQAVKTALGITGTVDLLNIDPIAKAASSTGTALTEALALQIKAAQVANVLVTGSLAVASAGGVASDSAYADILTGLVDAIGTLPAGKLDLASSSVLTPLLGGVSTNVINLLAQGNNLASASSLAAIYEYQKVVQDDLASAAVTGAASEISSYESLANLFRVVSSGQKVIDIGLAPGSDTGFSDSDNFTKLTSPQIRVDLSSVSSIIALGNSVEVKFGDEVAFQGIVTADAIKSGYMQFSFSDVDPLTNQPREGAKAFSVVVTDMVKNVPIASGFLAINIDKTVPEAGALVAPVAGDNLINISESNAGVKLTGTHQRACSAGVRYNLVCNPRQNSFRFGSRLQALGWSLQPFCHSD